MIAATITCLYGRAFDRSVTAKDAAITLLWLQYCFAIFAFIKVNAGISRHYFVFFMSQFGQVMVESSPTGFPLYIAVVRFFI